MASNMFLYWGSGSIPCWKPMLVLEEKELSGYSNKLVKFDEKEHKGDDVTKLNPRGQVPTFKDGDVVVNESGAICFYLENKFSDKGTKLLPDDNETRAQVLQRVFEVVNIDNCISRDIFGYRYRTDKDKLDQELLKTRYEAARNEFRTWDGYIKASDGFLVGSNFTMADVFFFPYIAFGVRVGLKLDNYSSIKAYYEKVKERPSVKATWPPHWSESPGDASILGQENSVLVTVTYIAFGVRRLYLKLHNYPSIKAYYDKLMKRSSVTATMPPHWKDKPADTSIMEQV